jgi:AcrR family transcriptional regulator
LAPNERRQLILAAAEQVFAERGFTRTSMEEVARVAGITKPVIYDHFDTKAALFLALLEGVSGELLERGRREREAASDDREKSFRAAIEAFFRFVHERPTAAKVLIMVPKSDPAAADAAEIVQARARQRIAAMLSQFVPRPSRRENEAMALFLQKGMHALAEWSQVTRGARSALLVNTVMQLAWHGMAPKAVKR